LSQSAEPYKSRAVSGTGLCWSAFARNRVFGGALRLGEHGRLPCEGDAGQAENEAYDERTLNNAVRGHSETSTPESCGTAWAVRCVLARIRRCSGPILPF
jgi:hypothetical protein